MNIYRTYRKILCYFGIHKYNLITKGKDENVFNECRYCSLVFHIIDYKLRVKAIEKRNLFYREILLTRQVLIEKLPKWKRKIRAKK